MYYVPGTDNDGNPNYVYFVAWASMHDLFVETLRRGEIPDFAAPVAMGMGKPTPEVREYMKDNYGFVHKDDT